MNNKAIIDMISYYKDEPMVQHTLKVFGYAQAIAAGEGIEGSEKDIIEYAALFHDVGIPAGIRECGSGAGPIQERRSPWSWQNPICRPNRSSAWGIWWGIITPSASKGSAICRCSLRRIGWSTSWSLRENISRRSSMKSISSPKPAGSSSAG